jgi:hypothetical protein
MTTRRTITDAVGVEWRLGVDGQLEARLDGAWREDHGLTVTTERVRALALLVIAGAGPLPLDFRLLAAAFAPAADAICEHQLLSLREAMALDTTAHVLERLCGHRRSPLLSAPMEALG